MLAAARQQTVYLVIPSRARQRLQLEERHVHAGANAALDQIIGHARPLIPRHKAKIQRQNVGMHRGVRRRFAVRVQSGFRPVERAVERVNQRRRLRREFLVQQLSHRLIRPHRADVERVDHVVAALADRKRQREIVLVAQVGRPVHKVPAFHDLLKQAILARVGLKHLQKRGRRVAGSAQKRLVARVRVVAQRNLRHQQRIIGDALLERRRKHRQQTRRQVGRIQPVLNGLSQKPRIAGQIHLCQRRYRQIAGILALLARGTIEIALLHAHTDRVPAQLKDRLQILVVRFQRAGRVVHRVALRAGSNVRQAHAVLRFQLHIAEAAVFVHFIRARAVRQRPFVLIAAVLATLHAYGAVLVQFLARAHKHALARRARRLHKQNAGQLAAKVAGNLRAVPGNLLRLDHPRGEHRRFLLHKVVVRLLADAGRRPHEVVKAEILPALRLLAAVVLLVEARRVAIGFARHAGRAAHIVEMLVRTHQRFPVHAQITNEALPQVAAHPHAVDQPLIIHVQRQHIVPGSQIFQHVDAVHIIPPRIPRRRALRHVFAVDVQLIHVVRRNQKLRRLHVRAQPERAAGIHVKMLQALVRRVGRGRFKVRIHRLLPREFHGRQPAGALVKNCFFQRLSVPLSFVFPPEPSNQQHQNAADQRAGNVDQNVECRHAAPGHEMLLHLVRHREQHDDRHRPERRPTATMKRSPRRAQRKHRQKEKRERVRQLANDQMQRIARALERREYRRQPFHNAAADPRGFRSRLLPQKEHDDRPEQR